MGSVNGRIVYDLKVQHIGILEAPLILDVENDEIKRTKGRHASEFRQICQERGGILRYISEISLGMNPAGRLTSNRLFIPEEKNLGTMHCGHGGNASYGNRIGPHLDGVLNRPTVELDGNVVMKDGKLSPEFIHPDLLNWLNQNQ